MLNENFLLVGALLLFIAVLAGKVAYRLGAPALLLFLGVGMVFGYNDFIPFHSYEFTQFLGMIALCIILFSGGMDTKFAEIRPVMTSGVVLATMGVVTTAFIVGGFVYLIAPYLGIEMSFLAALLLAATMSSTDSASVFSILRSKRQGLQQNLRPLLELESGSNDPMAYILTVLLVSMIGSSGGAEFYWVDTLRTFAVQMIVGAALGYLFGRASVWVINRINIRSNQSLYSIMLLACAFFSFAFTTLAYGNGYLAVYITGLVVGNYRIVHRHMLMTFFDSFTWLLQIVLFLALGLLVDVNSLLERDVLIMGLAVGAFMILVARPVATFIWLAPFRRFTAKARIYVSWVGLRGAVPIIFATYPVLEGVPGAEYIFDVVFLVTIISLVVQGTTVSGMANWLGLAYEELESVFKVNMPDSVKSEFSEIEVNESLIEHGDTLKDIHLPGGTLVVMVCRNEKYFVPKGYTRLAIGDKLLVVSDNNEELIRKAKDMGVEKFIRVE
ncbi:MAG: potassium/proton antiporter [Alistipes sp.]|nr:potassium/proton antiporter [Alistipes sp.]MDE6861231.1 potassium/proton antiporter [Alistipes sp.]